MPIFGEDKMLTNLRKLSPEAQEYILDYFRNKKIPYNCKYEPFLAIRFYKKFGLNPYIYPSMSETWRAIKSAIVFEEFAKAEEIADIPYPVDFPEQVFKACKSYLGKPTGACDEFYRLCDEFVALTPTPTMRDFIDFISDNSKRIHGYLTHFLCAVFFDAKRNNLTNPSEVVLNLEALQEFVDISPIPRRRARALLASNPERYAVCLFGRADKSRYTYNLVFPEAPVEYYSISTKYLLILWDKAEQKWILNAGLAVEEAFYKYPLATSMEDLLLD